MGKIIVIFIVFVISFATQLFADSGGHRNPFGVLTFLPWNEGYNNYMYDSKEKVAHAIQLLKELGVSIIRIDFSWTQIEKVQGKDELSRLDYIVQECDKNNIEVLGVLGYSPAWAGGRWNQPVCDLKLFADFSARMAAHYPQIKYWEIWNEPDSLTYWQPQDNMVTYTALLKLVYPAIKAANPGAVVLVGGLTTDGLYKLKSMLKNGAGQYFDILNLHPFVDPSNPQCVKTMGTIINNFAAAVRQYGFDKKIWITEIGCPGIDNSSKTWWNGPAQSEEEQAKFLKQAYNYLLNDPKVERIFWAFFQDTPDHFYNAVDDFGLIRRDFSKKRSFMVYKDIINNGRSKDVQGQ